MPVVPTLNDKKSNREDRLDEIIYFRSRLFKGILGFAGKNLYDLRDFNRSLTIEPGGEHYTLFPESGLACVTAAIQSDRETVYLFEGSRYTRFRIGMRPPVAYLDRGEDGYSKDAVEESRLISVAHGGALDDKFTLEPEVYRFAAAKWPGLEKFASVNPDGGDSQKCKYRDIRYDLKDANPPHRQAQAGDPPLWAFSSDFGAVGPASLYMQGGFADFNFDPKSVPKCKPIQVVDANGKDLLEQRSMYRSFACKKSLTFDQILTNPDALSHYKTLQEQGERPFRQDDMRSDLNYTRFTQMPVEFLGDWSKVKFVTIPIRIEGASNPRDFDLTIGTPNGSARCSFDKIMDNSGKKLEPGWNYVTIDLEDNSIWSFGRSNSKTSITDLLQSGHVTGLYIRVGGYVNKSNDEEEIGDLQKPLGKSALS